MEAGFVLSETERSAILDTEIQRLITGGFRLVARTSTTAQLVYPKVFSVTLAIVGLLFLVVGLLVYLYVYANQRDLMVNVTVDEHGQVIRQFSGVINGQGVAEAR